MAGSSGASSISVTVRVRPFTIREAAQLAKCDDGPLFLGDGSLAGVPTPKLTQKGIRPVVKVIDDKCLYVHLLLTCRRGTDFLPVSSTHLKTTPSTNSPRASSPTESVSRIRHSALTASSTRTRPRAKCMKLPVEASSIVYLTDTMPPFSPMEQRDAERRTLSLEPPSSQESSSSPCRSSSNVYRRDRKRR